MKSEDLTNVEQLNTKVDQLQKELFCLKQKYKLTLEHTSDTIFDYFPDKKCLVGSKTRDRIGIFKSEKVTVEGLIKSGVVMPKGLPAFKRLFDEINKGSEMAEAIVWIKSTNGCEVLCQFFVVNVLCENGSPIYCMGFIRDITMQYLLEKERQYINAATAESFLAVAVDVIWDTVLAVTKNLTNEISIEKEKSFSYNIDSLSSYVFIKDKEKFSNFFDRENIINVYAKDLKTRRLEFRINYGGKILWLRAKLNFVNSAVNDNIIIYIQVNNIDEAKRKVLKSDERQRYYNIIMSSSTITYEVNYTTDTVLCLEGYENKFDIKSDKPYSYNMVMLSESMTHADDKEIFLKTFGTANIFAAARRGEGQVRLEFRKREKKDNNAFVWVDAVSQFEWDDETNQLRGFTYIKDIDERKKFEQELIYNAQHDVLTGLYNKVTAQTLISEYLLSETGKQKRNAIVMFDLDNFKDINDKLGHFAGDKILKDFGSALSSICAPNDIIGRIGGDEFIMLVKNVKSDAQVLKKTNQAMSILKKLSVDYPNSMLAVSAGISYYSEHGKTFEELYKKADCAMYFAKASGKKQAVVFDPSMIK